MSKSPTMSAFAMSALVAATLIGGCSYHEDVCKAGEYVVRAKHNDTGRACVESRKPPPRGYTTYGPGETPTVP